MILAAYRKIRRGIMLFRHSPRESLERGRSYFFTKIRRLRGPRGEFAPYPKAIYISVNSTCNLKCKMCDYGQATLYGQFYKMTKRSGKSELAIKRLKGLIDEVEKFRPLVAVTSTEPLLYEGIVELLRYIKSKRLRAQVTTNGFLLGDFAESFVKEGLDYLWLSLDGPRAVHDRIRGNRNSFKKCISGIERVIDYKKRFGKERPFVNINYTISNHNYHSLSEFMRTIKGLPVVNITFSHMNFITAEVSKRHNETYSNICRAFPSSVASACPERVDVDRLFNEIRDIKRVYPGKASFIPDIFSKKQLAAYYREPGVFISSKKCFAPWLIAQILPNGDVANMTRCFDLVLGNIYRDDFSSIWNGRRYREWRRALRRYGSFPACSRCCGIF